jgi:copper chaperone CopZ
MKTLLILLATAAGLTAQLRSLDLSFTGIECASCIESMPARIQRMRGVESAKVDTARQLLLVKLAAQNRVRLEQIRDAVEQDGTKAREAKVVIEGTLFEEGGRWLLKVPGGGQFEISVDGGTPAVQYSLKPGEVTVSGIIRNLRPESGSLVIAASSIDSKEIR